MIKRGDRVKLTARAAAAFNNNKRPSMFDWTARRGVVERITTNKANAVVLWDGRKSTEVVPIRSVRRQRSSQQFEMCPGTRCPDNSLDLVPLVPLMQF